MSIAIHCSVATVVAIIGTLTATITVTITIVMLTISVTATLIVSYRYSDCYSFIVRVVLHYSPVTYSISVSRVRTCNLHLNSMKFTISTT